MPRDPTPAPVAPWSERVARLVVTALPAGAALVRLAHQPTWREDVAILRDVALVGVGPGGGVSTALAQVAGALPLGTLSFRAALVAVVALAAASRLGFALALRLLRAGQRAAPEPLPAWLAPAFAAIAVCGAGLSPTVQLAATVAGGATVAVALVLGAVALAARATDRSEDGARGRDVAASGLLLGAALAERPLAGGAALAAMVALLFTHRLVERLRRRAVQLARRAGRSQARSGAPPRLAPVSARSLVLAAALAAVSAVVVAAPAALRPIAPHRLLDLGFGALPAASEATVVATAIGAWRSELGVTPLALAVVGAIVLALRATTRPRDRPAHRRRADDRGARGRGRSARGARPPRGAWSRAGRGRSRPPPPGRGA